MREAHYLSTESHILSTDEVDASRYVPKLLPHMDPLHSVLHEQIGYRERVRGVSGSWRTHQTGPRCEGIQ